MTDRLAVLKTYKLYINGAFPRSESGRSFLVQNRQGEPLAHVSHGSRKDLRDAVEAASNAQHKWMSMSAYNRAQVMYRMAEMLEGKRDEFVEAIVKMSKHRNLKTSTAGKARSGVLHSRSAKAGAQREIDACVDRLMCFAGWADKYVQVLGCANPVAGPYYNFTIPEPTGLVGVIAPPSPAPMLLGLIALLAPPLCSGNAIVALADEPSAIPAALLGEVCATSDVPAGVINIITSRREELIDHLARHRQVNAISAANLPAADAVTLKLGIAENLKRVHIAKFDENDWFDASVCAGPSMIEPFVEMKTIWHPSAT